MLTTLARVSPAKAMPSGVPLFVYTTVPSSSKPPIFNITVDLTLEQVNFILLCAVVVAWFVVLFRYIRRLKQAVIFLEVASGNLSVLIPVMVLPLCPSSTYIRTPASILDLDVQGSSLRPMLHVSWSEFTIRNRITNKPVTVPELIPIGYYEAYKLKKILKRPFLVQLYKKHYGIMIPMHDWEN